MSILIIEYLALSYTVGSGVSCIDSKSRLSSENYARKFAISVFISENSEHGICDMRGCKSSCGEHFGSSYSGCEEVFKLDICYVLTPPLISHLLLVHFFLIFKLRF